MRLLITQWRQETSSPAISSVNCCKDNNHILRLLIVCHYSKQVDNKTVLAVVSVSVLGYVHSTWDSKFDQSSDAVRSQSGTLAESSAQNLQCVSIASVSVLKVEHSIALANL